MSDHNSEESNISKYKNLDEELESAIEQANSIFRNLAESILNVYNVAREKGYEPFEARAIVEHRIINVTPRYLREVLPEEAKHVEKRNLSLDMRNKIPHPNIIEAELVEEIEEPITIEAIDPIEPEPSQPNLHKDEKFVVKWELENTRTYTKTAYIDVTVDIDITDITDPKIINVRNDKPYHLHNTK